MLRRILSVLMVVLFPQLLPAQTVTEYLTWDGQPVAPAGAVYIRIIEPGTNGQPFHILSIQRKQDQHYLLRNGRGKYFGPGYLVSTGAKASPQQAGGIRDGIYQRQPSYGFSPFCDVHPGASEGTWVCGNFKNGLKTGTWYESVGGEQMYWKNEKSIPKTEKLRQFDEVRYGEYTQGVASGTWTLRCYGRIFSGPVKNGVPEGRWTTTRYPINRSWYHYREGMPPMLYARNEIVEGYFVNGKADSSWTIRDTLGALMRSGWFANGNWKGLTYATFQNGRPSLRAVVRGDSVCCRTYFSPRGDTVQPLSSNAPDQLPSEGILPKRGRRGQDEYLAWSPGGVLLQKGWQFSGGYRDSVCYQFGYRGDTTEIATWKNGQLDGPYVYRMSGEQTGQYKQNQRSGLWTEKDEVCSATVVSQWLYRNDNERLLQQCTENGRMVVVNGNGAVRRCLDYHSDMYFPPDDMLRLSITTYAAGKPVREQVYYAHDTTRQHLQKDVYFTAHGDSLVSFFTPGKTQTVKDGNGSISYARGREEQEQQIIRNGFPQTNKNDYVSPVRLSNTPHRYETVPLPPRPDELFATAPDTGIFIRRVIVHSKGTNVYTVWVRIAHADKHTFGRMLEQYPGSDPQDVPSMGDFNSPEMRASNTGELRFFWTSVPSDELLIAYRFYSETPPNAAYPGKWSFVRNSQGVHVQIKPENCLLIEK